MQGQTYDAGFGEPPLEIRRCVRETLATAREMWQRAISIDRTVRELRSFTNSAFGEPEIHKFSQAARNLAKYFVPCFVWIFNVPVWVEAMVAIMRDGGHFFSSLGLDQGVKRPCGHCGCGAQGIIADTEHPS